ncbi:SDR family NAD(P)-dependent oxidoreductase [Micromonospora zingiberis]|uniref:SDR family NAD(P)-dependent oxidoreductase n=2 Tax=Micromonospora zingiberis TaxID=2053011 RepID=A0A4R0G333_9ACTN|nr:SDR family NAD(P)-dependent oxidoreductase [Micromonospora zingiberis]
MLEYLQWVTAELKRSRERVAELETGTPEPVAVVATACRYPGSADTPEQLWRLVADGVDAITPWPDDRGWDVDRLYHPDGPPGTSYTRHGGFIDAATDFDAEFFGISAREALGMDPQQRVLLETTWELFERAGLDTGPLRGSRTGVFVGVGEQSYLGLDGPPELDGFMMTSRLSSIASGRIAYSFGLEGPVLSVDTACSSSLVALHLAARALRAGEADLAVAGGCTVYGHPGGFVDFSRQRGLARDGRCKSFDATADGTGWAEGTGLLLLERLADARRHGHRVLAVLRGSAINSDGASNGLTAPSGPAQQRVIRQALADARLTPADIDVVEAHGTGTRLGDPIEAQALLATYGQDRATPVLLGSLKSNIGHSVAAAGAGGVIKMIEAMRHGTAPRSLHLDTPNPAVDWTQGKLDLLTEARPWPDTGRPRRAAVSSFGVSGTNAHVILEHVPEPPEPDTPRQPGPYPFLLSARTADALRAQATRLHAHLSARPDVEPADAAYTLALHRTPLEHRAHVVAADRTELLDGLAALAAAPDTTPTGEPGRLAVIFSGQGAQRPGMGAALHTRFPAFAAALDEVCAAFDPHLDEPLRDVLFAADGTERAGKLAHTGWTQPALFAWEVALFRLAESLGVRVDLVGGHSLGEITAAHVAGVFDLTDAVTLVAARARLLQSLPSGGAMVAVAAPADQVRTLLDEYGDDVVIAAVNAPAAVTLAGQEPAVLAVAQRLSAQGIATHRLAVSHAFHSPLTTPVLDPLHQVAANLAYREPALPVVSNVTGALATPGLLTDPGYWVRQVRATVRFQDCVRALADAGATTFLEAGPAAVLTPAIAATLTGHTGVVVPAQTGHDQVGSLAGALATLHRHGHHIDWPKVLDGTGARPVDLPSYPFQRRRFWVTPPPADSAALGLAPADHPVLAGTVTLPDTGEVVLTGRFAPATQRWLNRHRVDGAVLVPPSALVELAIRAGDECTRPVLRRLDVTGPVSCPDRGLRVQIRVGAPTGDTRPVTLHGRPDGADVPWTLLATGDLAADALPAVPAAEGEPVPVRLPDGEAAGGYVLHPELLHAALAATGHDGDAYHWRDVAVHRSAATTAGVRTVATDPAGNGTAPRGLLLTTGDGDPLATVATVRTRPVDADTLSHARHRPGDALFRITWQPTTVPSATGPTPSIIDGRAAGSGDLAADLHRRTTALLNALHRHLAAPSGPPAVLLTRGATGPGPVTDPAAAALHGLARTAITEQPGRLVIVDLDGDEPAPELLTGLAATGEPEIALRAGIPYVPRVERVTTSPGPGPRLGAGTVLVTGLGTLGTLVAKHLATRHGVRNLLVLSRSGPDTPPARQLIADLAAAGATARVVACDVADRDALRDALTAAPPISAVFHTAGTIDDGLIGDLDPDRLARVLRPKADAAAHLHELTHHHDLAAFVLFSSLAATIGGAGQGNYAAANAFLDGLAAHRRATGLPATSIAWGLWAGRSGITGDLTDADRSRIARAGYQPIDPATGLAMLDTALRQPDPVLIGVPIDLDALRARPDTVPAVLRTLLPPTTRREPADARQSADNLADLAGLTGDERRDALTTLVRTVTADVLGRTGPDSLPADRTFTDLGIDSLLAVELRNRLAQRTDLALPATTVFDHPTPQALADYLDTSLLDTGPDQPAGVDLTADVTLPDDIRPAPGPTSHGAPRHVLLTGATGFVGAFLLRELLATTTATVHCLVRANDPDDAWKRLRATARWYRIEDQLDPGRVVPVVGDLAADRLGLTPGVFDTLARDIDVVYHAGATVNWLQPYAALRAPNVDGTREVLRLAAAHRTVPVHHVSTTGVFAGTAPDGHGHGPHDPTGPAELLPSGYLQSKWVAEQIIGLARDRGLPVSVYRVDLVSGDRRHGACQTRDYLWLSIKGLIQTGRVPDRLGGSVALVPVDHVAASIIALSADSARIGGTYHLYNRERVAWSDILDRLRAHGHLLPVTSWAEWHAAVLADRDNALYPLLDAFELMVADTDAFYPVIDTSDTDVALAAAGLPPAPVTADVLDTYLRFFTEVGYLPPALATSPAR